MEPMAQNIASKGYACFAVEYRLSSEAIFPAGIYDIKNAIQFVKANAEKFKIDTAKVAILGCSSGGQMAALIGTTNHNMEFEDINQTHNQSSSVQAIVDLDGVLAFIHPESSEGEMASLWLGGNSCDKLETWIEASAITHTDKNTAPILFVGSQYPRFLAGKNDMIKILDQYGIYSQVETIENSPHSFWLFHPWFEDSVRYITHFLDKTLKEN
jgi:pectinesterase